MKRLIPILALVLTGCVSMRVPNVRPAYAPDNEPSYGVVSYKNGTSSIANAARRQEAYKQMFNACGHYRIVSERDDDRGAVGVFNDGMFIAGKISTHYIQFECTSGNEAFPGVSVRADLPPPPIVNP